MENHHSHSHHHGHHHEEEEKHCGGGCCCHSHGTHEEEEEGLKNFLLPGLSFLMLVAGIIMNHTNFSLFNDNIWFEFLWYATAFIPVGLSVLKEAALGLSKMDFFNEFTLMSLACIGAFCIGEFPEAVGVMLFYSVGELLQDRAVDKAKRNISKLLDVRGDQALVVRQGKIESVDPKTVGIGESIEVRPGQRVPLDGFLESENGVFDTSALTGESVPQTIEKGSEVFAGMISSDSTVRIKVNKEYGESAISRILDLVSNASSKKAHTELFIRKFSRYYTPAVILLASLLVFIPWLVSLAHPAFHFVFSEWLYRALVFLVISCPCALVISVPLGYFAGIGAASKAGILFKGGNYLDAIIKIDTIAFDKTGTLTTGKFTIEKIESVALENLELLQIMAAAELNSSHPLAKALVRHAEERGVQICSPETMQEIAGYGSKARVNGKTVVAGSLKLLEKENIDFPENLKDKVGTIIACGIDGKFAGYAVLSDTLKPDAEEAIKSLKKEGIKNLVMLSGDKKNIVEKFAGLLGIGEAHGELLPQDKAQYVENISKMPDRHIAFVGDGMNDAPVLALSNVGIAMGGLGSDAAIESADVVIQTDKPSRISTAIKIGRSTHTIVKENIIGALSVKLAVMILGAFGIASLWAAVFADVGVALLAVVNSMRIMWKKWR